MSSKFELSDEQRSAVDSNDQHILCLAGAGSGKTRVLIERVVRLVQEGVNPESILVLTFTNAAAFEMSKRFSEYCVECLCDPEFRTFHAFCYSLIVSDPVVRSKLGYIHVPEIVDDYSYKRITQFAKMQCGTKLSQKKLDGITPVSDHERFEYDVYRKAVNRQLIAENLITFDKLCNGVCRLFETKDSCVDRYKKKYHYIFVDEFQDTDKYQWRFVKSFEQSNIFLVADALQAIYAFRGADSSIVKELASNISYRIYKLTYNYRSTYQICQFANENSKYADSSYRLELKSDRQGSYVTSVLVNNSNHTSYVDSISEDLFISIKSQLDSFKGSIAILCRTNNEVSKLQDRFGSSEDSKRYSNADIHDIFKSVYSDEYLMDWVSSYLNYKQYSDYLMSGYFKDLQEDLSLNTKVWDKFIHKFESFLDHHILDCYFLVKSIRTLLDDKSDETYKEILNLLEVDEFDYDSSDFEGFESSVMDHLFEKDEDSNNLYIGTIHSSKGLEYDNVILVGVGGKSFPLTSEENNNLYYVGITRAKNNLIVYKES